MHPELVDGIVFYLVFLLSTTVHEAAHAWVALKGGDPTAYHGGQVTLDPIPHIRREPFGMVVLPLLTVVFSGWPLGFASAPYDPAWEERYPKRAAWMALAGPGANFLLVLIAGVAINAGLFAGVFEAPESIGFADVTEATGGMDSVWGPIAYLFGSFFALNLLLGVFNLIPLPPLDGSSGIGVLLPTDTARRYASFLHEHRGLALFGFLMAWGLFDVLFSPVFTLSLNVLYLLMGVSYS